MKNSLIPLLFVCGTLFAAEPVVKAPIVRVGVFTDGISSVIRQFTPPPENVIIDEDIRPIEGSLAVTPSDAVSLTKASRTIKTATENPFEDIGAFFQGKNVTVTLQAAGDGPAPIYSGTLLNFENYITLKQSNGKFVSFAGDRIADISCDELPLSGEIEKQVWLFQHKSRIGGPSFISYLTNGISWVPAMRLTLLPENKMEIRRSATITNNLEDLQNAEITLFSGSPNIYTAGVPKAARMKFTVANAAALAYDAEAPAPEVFTPESGSTEDIQARSIGKHTLKKNDVLFLPLESAETTFERIVIWNINDKRDSWGRASRSNSNNPLYDAITFVNPFKEAICSSIAHVVDGGKELGLIRSGWINPNGEATLNIGECFTVTGKQLEYEESRAKGSTKTARQTEYIAGTHYAKIIVNGEIILKNHRKTTAKIKIKQLFSGELIKCETPHELTYLDRGIYSVNPQGELKWVLDILPGKEEKLTYQYSVLVRQ